MNKKKFTLLASLVILVIFLIGCSTEENIYEKFTLEVEPKIEKTGEILIEPEKKNYNKGEEVLLTAKANKEENYIFSHWQGSGYDGEEENPLKIEMLSDIKLIAVFEEKIGNNPPVIESITNVENGEADITEGEEIELEVTASDADGDSLEYSISGDDADKFVQSGNVFSWTPLYDDYSNDNEFHITIEVSDGTDTVTEDIVITVNDDKTAPSPPTIEGITAGSYNTDQSFTISGETGATIDYSLDGGSSWNEYTEEVILADEDSYEITARQTDKAGNTSENSDVITVVIDKTAPAWATTLNISRSPDTSSVGISTAIDEDGIVYYKVMDDEAGEPTAAEVKEAGNKTAMTAEDEKEIMVTGLQSGTDYDIYLVAEDDNDNLQSDGQVKKVDVKTEGAYFEITINETVIEESIVKGDAVKIPVTVENTGEIEGTQTVEINVKDTNNKIVHTDSKEVTLESGESQELEFTNWILDNEEDEGDYEVEVNSDDSQDTVELSIEYKTGDFDINIGWDMPPSAPENVIAEEVEENNNKAIKISWDGVDNADSYIVARYEPENRDYWREIAEGITDMSDMSYIDSDIVINRQYKYAVIAVKGEKSSDLSEPTDIIVAE